MSIPAPFLAEAKVITALLDKYGFRFQKRFGQNFLIDSHVIKKILRAADIRSDDIVLEIGPGFGTLTQYLSSYAAKVVAVEIDKNAVEVLKETLLGYDNVKLVNADFMKTDLVELLELKQDRASDLNIKVVANLPYYITTPVIMKLLESGIGFESMTFMIQKEVAERICAMPGSKEYGALTLAVGFYAKPVKVANVPPNCFIPRPDVSSTVILLQHKDMPEVSDKKLLFDIIKAAFGKRRKTLSNALMALDSVAFDKGKWCEVIIESGIEPMIRGEKLSLDDFIKLEEAAFRRI